MRTYPGWSGSSAAGPTQVSREDRPGSYTESIVMTATPGVTSSAPDGSESVSGIQRLSRDFMDNSGRVIRSDRYSNTGSLTYSTSASLGTLSTNYDETSYKYDTMGRRNYVKGAGGTITRTVFDTMGRAISLWMGTNDSGATDDDPSGLSRGTAAPGSGETNKMVMLSANVYDAGSAGGDGDLTQMTQYVDASTSRVTSYDFDWRDRRTGMHDAFFDRYYTLDNLDRVTELDEYDSGGITALGGSVTHYDNRGRVYQTQTGGGYDEITSTTGLTLTGNNWYDGEGNLIKSKSAGGGSVFTKNVFDGANRLVRTHTGFDSDSSESSYSAALTPDGDTILTQNEYDYGHPESDGSMDAPSGAEHDDDRLLDLEEMPFPASRSRHQIHRRL